MDFRNINSIEELLIHCAAAPSIEELYDIYVENKPVFSSNKFYELLSLDPTYEQGSSKVGSYILWLIKMFKKNPDKINEDGYKAREYLETFDAVKGRLRGKEKSIDSYASLPELYAVIEPFIDKTQSDSQLRREVRKEKDNIDVIYEDDFWKVLIPNSYEASCYWGSESQWCTASRSSSNFYDDYTKKGNLFIIINKTDPEQKYQYHYSSNSFMDATDDPVDMKKFINHAREVGYYDFADFLAHDLQEIGYEDYFEKQMEAEMEDFPGTFEDGLKYEFAQYIEDNNLEELLLDENGNLDKEIKKVLQDIIYDNSLYYFEEWSGYINWDKVTEIFDENLPTELAKIQHNREEEKMEEEQEEGQQFLF